MDSSAFNLSRFVIWDNGLPRPEWDRISEWMDQHAPLEMKLEMWGEIGRQWLTKLGPALGPRHEVIESENFVALVSQREEINHILLSFAERSRSGILSALDGVAEFAGREKDFLIILPTAKQYYRYIGQFYPEGTHGGSGGIHIRDGYSHVVLYGRQLWSLENALAHELTHVALQHLSLPLWVEEGLAQVFEKSLHGSQFFKLDVAAARRQKEFWTRHGLSFFWSGEGFGRPDDFQELSYQLAEILVRLLLVEVGRPRWFGIIKEPRRRLLEFFRSANYEDGGEAACRLELGFGLSDLAAKFLGQGPWFPGTPR